MNQLLLNWARDIWCPLTFLMYMFEVCKTKGKKKIARNKSISIMTWKKSRGIQLRRWCYAVWNEETIKCNVLFYSISTKGRILGRFAGVGQFFLWSNVPDFYKPSGVQRFGWLFIHCNNETFIEKRCQTEQLSMRPNAYISNQNS